MENTITMPTDTLSNALPAPEENPAPVVVPTPAAPVSSLDRLRQQKAGLGASKIARPEKEGYKYGELWATNVASYEELKRLEFWWGRYQLPPSITRVCLAHEIIKILVPGVAIEDINGLAETLFSGNPQVVLEGVPNDYVKDFVGAALDVLHSI